MPEHESVKDKPRIMWWEKLKPNPVNYQNNCPWNLNHQKHHILPYTAFKQSIDEAKGKAGANEHFETALKYFTKWNLNDAANLMSLPTRKAYQVIFGNKGENPVPGPPLGNLPCHQPVNWGHWDYNKLVKTDVDKVWVQVSIKLEDHKLSANDVSAAIIQLETKWKGKLTVGRLATVENWRAMIRGDDGAHNNFTMVELEDSPYK